MALTPCGTGILPVLPQARDQDGHATHGREVRLRERLIHRPSKGDPSERHEERKVVLTHNNSSKVYVYNTTRQTFLATNATVADSYLTRLVGLLGKTRCWARPGQGLWIVPSCGVHTIGMLFSIDLVFLDRNSKVVHLEEHVGPFRISKVIFNARSVLELPPHMIFRTRTQVGDRLEIGPLQPPARVDKFVQPRDSSARNASPDADWDGKRPAGTSA